MLSVRDGRGKPRPYKFAVLWRCCSGRARRMVLALAVRDGQPDAAVSVLRAMEQLLASGGPRTPDLGGTASTDEVGEALEGALAAGGSLRSS